MEHQAKASSLRALPAVGTLIAEPEIAPLVAQYGKPLVTEAVRWAIEDARKQVLAGMEAPKVSAKEIAQAARALSTLSLRPKRRMVV